MLEEAHFGFLLLQSKHTLTFEGDKGSYLILLKGEEAVEDGISLVICDVGTEELLVLL
jgi:hypothetical protein